MATLCSSAAAVLLLLAASCQAPTEAAITDGDVAARQLFDRYFDWRLQDNPEFATEVGNHSYDDRLTSVSLQARRARLVTMHSYLDQLDKLAEKDLSYHTKVSIKILREKIKTYIDGDQYKGYLLQSTFLRNVAKSLRLLVTFMKFETEDDYRNLLKRYAAFPRKVKEIMMLLRLGVEEGMVLHNASMETVPEQLRAFNVSVEESEFFRPFQSMPVEIQEPVRSELRVKGEQAVKIEVLGELFKLADFLESEYLPNTREEVGVRSLPNGEAFYAACLRYHTSTDHTAEEIHQIGLDEVDRIEKQMKKIAVSQGFRGENISAFSEKLRTDPSNFHSDPDALLRDFTDIIQNRIQPQLPSVVWQLPKDDVIVAKKPANEKNAIFASYQVPPFDGSRPGKFEINIYSKSPKYEMLALTLHETNPGHHLYFSSLKSNAGLPKFQRTSEDRGDENTAPSGLPSNTAIIEGWGLYAESLGEAMNLYESRPIERYGGYSLEIYRACRLVVDTGLHAFNWTQQQAVQYMLEHTAAPRIQLENEVRRYITWPGQATAYKIGELHLKDLRSRAIKRLEQKFDLRTFHQVVLDCAGPLSVVEHCVDKYIEDEGLWVTAALSAGPPSAAGFGHTVILLSSSILCCFSRRW